MKMKRIWTFGLVVFLTGVLAAQNVKSLYIYHTNDMHSRVEPFSDTFADTLLAGKAGMARRAAFLQQERKKHKDLLLFDAGDFSQGTPFYNLFKGEVEIRLMNHMKYDACAIGNHEFDFGLENMARLFKMAEFPVVCANYDVKGTVLEDWSRNMSFWSGMACASVCLDWEQNLTVWWLMRIMDRFGLKIRFRKDSVLLIC